MKISSEAIEGFHCPRWNELPGIPLYMDQVVLVLEESIGLFAEGERVVTSTMINNYVKHKLIGPPEKKKYGREHIAALIVVSIMKRVLSMSEIAGLMNSLVDALKAEQAYDLFCGKLENALRYTFVGGMLKELGNSLTATGKAETPEAALGAALTALMGKLNLQNFLEGLDSARDKAPAAGEKSEKGKGK